VFDADTHYYEPDDAFTRHLPSELRSRGLWIDRANHGWVMLGDRRLGFFSVAAGDHVGPPGTLKAYFRGKGQFVLPNTDPVDGLAVPEYVDRRSRLDTMERLGVDGCFVLPSWGVGVEPELRADPEVCIPSVRAFNEWVDDDWGFDDGRIYGAAILSLVDVDAAAAEVERLAAAGCRLVCMTPGPIDGRSPADPHFDPVWARLEETGIVAVHHIGASGMCAVYAVPWGERPHPPSHRHSALEMFLGLGERPVNDTWAALVLHNLFDRFPRLRVCSIENGASWLPGLMTRLDKTYVAGVNKDSWRFGRPSLTPSETIRRNFWIVPYYEDDIPAVVAAIGPSQVLAGSDWPHPEGLADPKEFAEELTGLDDDTVRRIMGDNARDLIGEPQ
jgi:predicted TIM-barrel fold metal-dependent hydrolase